MRKPRLSVGRPLRGKSKRVRASFTLPPEDLAWLRQRSKLFGRSQSETVEMLITRARNEADSVSTSPEALVEKYPTEFWDISPDAVAGGLHSAFIIERILEHGTLSSVRDLFFVYTRGQIIEVIRKSRRISRKTALFWQSFLGVKGSIHCLDKELVTPLLPHWE